MLLTTAAVAALAGTTARAAPAPADPYLWLESVDSPRAMAWVNARNAYSTGVLEADPRYMTLYQEALAIAGAKDRIPQPSLPTARSIISGRILIICAASGG